MFIVLKIYKKKLVAAMHKIVFIGSAPSTIWASLAWLGSALWTDFRFMILKNCVGIVYDFSTDNKLKNRVE